MENNEIISNQVIMHGILKHLKAKGYKKFTARPWNYFMPESTLWWLVPSTDWPSYKYAKLVLYRTIEGYSVGFHIEKGISEIAVQILSSKSAWKLCTKPDWAWNILLSDLSDGKFENRLKEISNSAKKPLRILLQASIVTSEYDPYSEKIESLETEHSMAFEYMDGNLQILQDELKGEMRKYGNINKVNDLIGVFQEKDLEWFWVDMFVTFTVDSDKHNSITTLALEIFENFADYFG